MGSEMCIRDSPTTIESSLHDSAYQKSLELAISDVESGGGVGAKIWGDLPEIGIVGLGTVSSNKKPEITSGPGNLVTGTFTHSSADVVDLRFEEVDSASQNDQDLSIGTTQSHPFWSDSRSRFVQVKDLRIGELVSSIEGPQMETC